MGTRSGLALFGAFAAALTVIVSGGEASAHEKPPRVETCASAPAAPTPAPAPAPAPAPTPGGTVSTGSAAGGWGAPLASSDEFNGTRVDATKWGQPSGCWEPNSTVRAGRCGANNVVSGGTYRQIGKADGTTGYLSSTLNRRYGKTEIRMRITRAATSGREFHPVLLLWPRSERWPQDGEIDWVELDGDDTRLTAFIHRPSNSASDQREFNSGPVDISAWHNYALEWTPAGFTGYVDGKVWFRDTDPRAQPPGPMHQTIQLDNFEGSGMKPTTMEIDYVRYYS